jgi:hypothetical protein
MTELTPQEIYEINREAEEYAKSQYVWPLNKHGEKMTQMVGQVNPPFFRKQIEPIKKHYAVALRSERLKHKAEIQALCQKVETFMSTIPITNHNYYLVGFNESLADLKQTLNQFKGK